MGTTRDNRLKCDQCGKFVALIDLENGRASHRCIVPSSLCSDEVFETQCSRCTNKPASDAAS